MPVNIAIVEDKELAMRSCENKLSQFTDCRVVLKASNGYELLKQIRFNPADIVLMDIEMPVMDGIAATMELKQMLPHIKVLMLTTFDDDEKIFKAIMAGASGYILKEENADTLHKYIIDAINGGASMSAGIALKALNLIRNPVSHDYDFVSEDFGLTKREIEILEQLKNGLSYDQISANLNISSGTVRKHIENIYRKLHVNNKVDAVQKAGKNRII
ncbi:response regulator transcription factor [soil metagenome]